MNSLTHNWFRRTFTGIVDEHCLIMNLFGGLSSDDRNILNDLKESGAYKTARVIDYSAVSKDADEIRNSDKFKRLAVAADQLVGRQSND